MSSDADATPVEGLLIRSATKTFPGRPPVPVLRGVDLIVEPGTLVAVLGPSGSGKSTLLRAIAGFERIDEGEIILDGRTLSGPGIHTRPERRHIGIVPQEGALFPHLDVAANVAFGLGRPGSTWRWRRSSEERRRISEVLELVDLAGYAARRPHELSGGQQQRVALARALAPSPDLILLDEPFAALDTALRVALRDDVADLLHRSGTTAILVTHDQGEALTMADRVAILADGRILQHAPPEDLYYTPTSSVAAATVGDINIISGSVLPDGATARTMIGTVPIADPLHLTTAQSDWDFIVRPEQFVLQRCTAASASHSNGDIGGSNGMVIGQVTAVRFGGHESMIEFTVGDTRLTARKAFHSGVQTGDTVRVSVQGTVAPITKSE